jgi:exodeoxyribonuclease VIII
MSLPDFMLTGTEVSRSPGAHAHALTVLDVGPGVGTGDDRPEQPPPPFVTGVFNDMPAETYFAIEAISQSGAGKILKSPMHYITDRRKQKPPTETMIFGSAVHAGVLEPETFAQRVVVAPEFNKRTTVGKIGWESFRQANAGKITLTVDDYHRAQRCIDAVLSHPGARRMLDGAIVETSLFWIDGKYKVPCKARLDIRSHGGITDLKTTADASPEEFAKSIANYGYTIQSAHYFSGAEHTLDATPEFFIFIAVESQEPHAVALYQMPSNGILVGAHKMNIALERYAAALAAGRWDGYPATIETITLPRWATTLNV